MLDWLFAYGSWQILWTYSMPVLKWRETLFNSTISQRNQFKHLLRWDFASTALYYMQMNMFVKLI